MLPVDRLDSLEQRFSEVEEMLCQPNVLSDHRRMTELNRERGELLRVVEVYHRYQRVQAQLEDDREALSDPELREMAEEEIPELEAELAVLEQELQVLLLPDGPERPAQHGAGDPRRDGRR